MNVLATQSKQSGSCGKDFGFNDHYRKEIDSTGL
jgi:hypothetical protein